MPKKMLKKQVVLLKQNQREDADELLNDTERAIAPEKQSQLGADQGPNASTSYRRF
jgi:hypothetical protein